MKAMLSHTSLLQWHDGLAPGHERDDGRLTLGGIDAADLADTYGTPLHVIDFSVLDAAIEEFVEHCSPRQIEIAYAGKALLTVALARRLARSTLRLDVCSIGELVTAERGGFPAERITMHGSGKTSEELGAAASGRVGLLVADSAEEIEWLAARVPKARLLPVMMRVNTGVAADTHAFVQTGGEGTKFGIMPDEVPMAAAALRRAPGLRFAGLHSHIGSQILDAAAFVANAEALMQVAQRLSSDGVPCERINVGGGFGVQVSPEAAPTPEVGEVIAVIADSIAESAQRSQIEHPQIGIEPGRALIARAGTSLYRVAAVKPQGDRTFVVVDGGMADNPRPAIYGAYHHAICASRETRDLAQVTLCGRSCENDELGPARLPKDLRAGELIALCTTGAYTYSMASNYNRFPRPALVAVEDGKHSLLARRQSIDEVLQDDA